MFGQNTRNTYTVQPPLAWIKKVALVVVVSGFIGIIWYAASQRDNLNIENVKPALVLAPKFPIKERLASPNGGMEVPHQDKQVFDLLAGAASDDAGTPKVEKAAPVAEPTTVAIEPEKTEKPVVVKEKVVEEKADPIVTTTAPVKPVEKIVKAEEAKPQLTTSATPASTIATTGTGWGVQLGSFRSATDAEKGVEILRSKYKDILEGLTPVVRRAELKKGTFYRVVFIGLENKEAARNLCLAFKQRSQGCLNVKL